jgi:hypothetical protein
VFAVRVDSARRGEMEAAIRRLRGFYEGAGMPHVTLRWFPGLSLAAGAFSARPVREPAGQAPWALTWGEPVPSPLRGVVHEAPDDALALITGTTIHLEVGDRRGRIVSGSALPSVLFESEAPGRRAWATHAVAATYLARGAATLNRAAVPEQLAADFVGGADTLVSGAAALAPAAVVELEPDGCRRRTFASARERWAQLPAGDARAAARDALETTLAGRAHPGEPWLGLTGGLDSLAVAVALTRQGLPFRAFTWGEPDWPDTVGASRAAARLGVEHVVLRPEPPRGAELRRAFTVQVRGSDGAATLNPLTTLAHPEPLDTIITGGGGEIGRAFYYRQTARNHRRPSARQLRRVLRLERAITGARPEAVDRIRSSVAAWIDAAEATGATGWRCLDVVYGEQRVRRWGRAMIPALAAPTLAAFASADTARALMSMPLEDRLTSAAQRTVIQDALGDQHLPHGDLQRRGAPAAVRRLAAAIRSRRGAPTSAAWAFHGVWDDLPDVRDWLADGVLRSMAIVDSMGEDWARATRRGFLDGRERETVMALRAAGPATLDADLAALAGSEPGRA